MGRALLLPKVPALLEPTDDPSYQEPVVLGSLADDYGTWTTPEQDPGMDMNNA